MTPRVDLLLETVPRDHASARGLLDPGEVERYRRLRRPGDRAAYAVSHAARRMLVALRCSVDPELVTFVPAPCRYCGGPHGKPRVMLRCAAGPRPLDVECSLSRTSSAVCVAVTSGFAIGVDVESVERLSSVELSDLDDTALDAFERDDVRTADAHSRAWVRARYWVAKEAVLKLRGTGLATDPTSVPITPSDEAVGMRDGGAVPVLRLLDDLDGHLACLAIAGESARWHLKRVPMGRLENASC